MAAIDQQLYELGALVTTPDAGDLAYIVDVSDTTDGIHGTNKKIAYSVLTGGFATSGANSNITSLTGLTTPLSVSQGGTSVVTLTGILKGNGTSAFTAVTAPSGTIVGTTDSQTLTNKDLSSGTNTLPTEVVTLTGSQTLTNKTLTAPIIATISNSGTLTLPAVTDTVAVLGTAQTYTATLIEKQVIWTNNAIAASSNAATVPITHRLNTVTNSSAATLTITMTTTSAVDGALSMVRVLDFSGVAQTITWVNTENSGTSVPTTSNGSTTLPLTVGFQYNSQTSKWRCIASA